jgi:cysteine desulfurase / selenocysteine lyase
MAILGTQTSEGTTGEQALQEASNSASLSSAEVARIRLDFPALQQIVHGYPLVYLDNAATSQKPQAVLDAVEHYYSRDCANVHRGVHLLSQRASDEFDEARRKVQKFLNADHSKEVIFTRGTTDAINLVASTYGRKNVSSGDEILITALEHHSNIVPWQLLCGEKGATLQVAPITSSGEVILEEFERLLGPKTKLAAISHISNALGTINPVEAMIKMAHRKNIPVLVDGAQAVPHTTVDVKALDCDFYAFSAHKLYGPTGVGVLYGRAALLDAMPPYQGGGDMIRTVSFTKTTYNSLPYKFEAGTPHIAGAIGLGAAIDYVQTIGLDRIAAYERQLLTYASERLQKIEGIRTIGTARNKAGLVSFVLEGVHPHDLGTILDRQGIAVRAGHHCAMPVMELFGLAGTTRASFAVYNTQEEIDLLIAAVLKAREVFA